MEVCCGFVSVREKRNPRFHSYQISLDVNGTLNITFFPLIIITVLLVWFGQTEI